MRMLLCGAVLFLNLPLTVVSITCTDATTASEVLKDSDLTGQTYVITGGDSGIGYATATALASKNATIVLGCRDPTGKGRAAVDNITRATGNPHVSVEKLDLASFDSVRQFATTVATKVQKIHTLLCNAGIDHNPQGHETTVDGFDMTFQVDYLAHFLLVEELLPVLRESKGRVINVASAGSFEACSWGKMASSCTDLEELPKDARRKFDGSKNLMGAITSNYGVAKFLQVFHAAELARTEPEITAYSLHPGLVKSGMTDKLPAGTIRRWCFGHLTNCPLSAEEGATTPAHVATADVASSNGDYFYHCTASKSVRSNMVQKVGENATIVYQQKVYAMSKEWTKRSARIVV